MMNARWYKVLTSTHNQPSTKHTACVTWASLESGSSRASTVLVSIYNVYYQIIDKLHRKKYQKIPQVQKNNKFKKKKNAANLLTCTRTINH